MRTRQHLVAIALLWTALGCERCQRVSPSPPLSPPVVASAGHHDEPAAPDTRAPSDPGWPTEAHKPPVADTGIFGDVDARVQVRLPSWLAKGPEVVVGTPGGEARFVVVDGVAVGFAPGSMPTTFEVPSLAPWDRDGDAIPDPLDILIGAKKTVLNGAAYRSTYRVLPYPGGDIPRTEGVCTDVIVRALRNAGIDLQKEIHEDAKARRSAYPGIGNLDRSIDHRRVRNLLPYFKRYWTSLPADPKDTSAPWMPGDVVFLDTMNDAQPEHMGVVSDRLGESGFPLLVNNWTDGHRTAEMDLLSFVPVRGRFRVPVGRLAVPVAHAGLEGLLSRGGVSIPVAHRQVVVVTAPTWDSSSGELRRFERRGGSWAQVGTAWPVVVGERGMGLGRGVVDGLRGRLPEKKEGDLRSPAGVFRLGDAFGPDVAPPYAPGTWPWKPVGDRDRWVDDPRSSHYNTWQRQEGTVGWSSAEDLSQYALGVVVEHNREPVVAGAGSAIFLHVWRDASTPTLGCTALAKDRLVELLRWLRPDEAPVLVQLAGRVYEG